MHSRIMAAWVTCALVALVGPAGAWAQAEPAAQLFQSKCLHCHTEETARALPAGDTWADFLQTHRAKAAWLISTDDAATIANFLTAEERKGGPGQVRRISFAEGGTRAVSHQLVISPAGQLHANVVNARYQLAPGAYGAVEFMLSGVPFFEALAVKGLQLDPELASITSEDAFWYSRYNTEVVELSSGMGLHLVHARNIVLQANEDNVSPQEYMDGLLENYRQRTGLEEVPEGYFPVFAEFASGSPFFQEIPDFEDPQTLRWDPSKFEKSLSTAGLGYSLAAQTLWAGYFLGATHGEGFVGNDPEEGFRGALLATEAINKLYLLRDELAYDGRALGDVNPSAYEAKLKYFPHRYGVEVAYDDLSAPPKPGRYTVADTSSQLADQAALLWGASEFYHFSDPKVEDAWDALFGLPADGGLFPPETHDLAGGVAHVVQKNLVAMHFDPTKKTFVSSWDNGERGDTLTAADAGRVLVALARAHAALHDRERLVADIEKLIEWQADYLSTNMQQRDGGFVEAINVTTAAQSAVPRTLLGQALAVRGLLAAHGVTGKREYLDSAMTVFQFMEQSLWSATGRCYRTVEGSDLALHTPETTAATLAALRELVLASASDAPLNRFKTFFQRTVKQGGLQMAELAEAGETADSQVEALMPDTDSDGVRKPAFAGGSYGAAPVLASLVEIPTP